MTGNLAPFAAAMGHTKQKVLNRGTMFGLGGRKMQAFGAEIVPRLFHRAVSGHLVSGGVANEFFFWYGIVTGL
jgi:hypothetical protein